MPISRTSRYATAAGMLLAARNLGASATVAFLKVTLPLSLPGIIAGTVIVFSISASTFITPALLGGSRTRVMAYLIYEQNLVLLNWSFGAAISFIIVAFVTFVLIRNVNRLRNRYQEPDPVAAPTTKSCPYCITPIPLQATRCPACTSGLTENT